MNILFIEDERDLSTVGITQLEKKGYKVFPAYNLDEAQAILDDPALTIHYVIADHRLPDGLGVQFLIEKKKRLPRFKCAVVSAYLTTKETVLLKANQIPYFHKPLLYSKVIDELRRMYAQPIPKDVSSKDVSSKDVSPVLETPDEATSIHADTEIEQVLPLAGAKAGIRKFFSF